LYELYIFRKSRRHVRVNNYEWRVTKNTETPAILHSTKFVAIQQPGSEPSPTTTRSGAYSKNGYTRQALKMSTSYDAGMLRNWTSWTSA